MLETTQTPDRRPVIAIVPWDSGFRAWDPHDSREGQTWHPQGAQAATLKPDQDGDLAGQLVADLGNHALSAVLLVGRSFDASTIHIQTRAENRIPGSQDRDDPLAAGVVRATLSTADIIHELDKVGLSARAVSESENDTGSQLLFRILSKLPDGVATPPVGLIRLPRNMAPDQVNLAIRTVATTVSRHLPALIPAE